MPKKTKNYQFFIVKGDSMLPILKHNQKIKIVKTKDVKIGDIIVFKGKKNKIVHRIVKINENKIITKGDHKYGYDLPITHKEILGKLIKIGNKRVDTSYYKFINPFIARMSYFSIKINPISYQKIRNIYNHLSSLKMKLIGDKNFHIQQIIFFFLSLPHKINYRIFRSLKK